MLKENVDYKGLWLNDLVSKYNETNEERYFNELWSKVKPFSIMKAKRYPSIEFDDIISNSMECLWIALNTIKKDSNLLTYYGKILESRFFDIYNKKMQSKKYKMNSEALSIDSLKEDLGYEPSIDDIPFSLELFEYECKLAGIEITIVELVNAGFKQREIINKLKLTKEGYSNLLNNIKTKIRNNYLGENYRI